MYKIEYRIDGLVGGPLHSDIVHGQHDKDITTMLNDFCQRKAEELGVEKVIPVRLYEVVYKNRGRIFFDKPAPQVGMPVTWIRPEEDPANEGFIETDLIRRIGCDGLKVLTTEQGRSGEWYVTIEKNGNPVGPKHQGEIFVTSTFSWDYLVPLDYPNR